MYQLSEIQKEKPTNIDCKYFSPKEKLKDNIDVLVVSFYGEYPNGSKGKKHATFISDKVISGLINFDPDAIILDFRELHYSWGNSLLGVFQNISQFKDAGNEEGEPEFPAIILTSEKSKNGLLSLLTPATSKEIPDFIFEDEKDALKSAEERGYYWLNN
jgi:hypothetical protein